MTVRAPAGPPPCAPPGLCFRLPSERLPAVRSAPCPSGVAVAMGVARLATAEDLKAGVEDRAYRLHHNQRQNRVDLFANVGAFVVLSRALRVPSLFVGLDGASCCLRCMWV